jgi:DNA-binding transcriptional MerR regulator
LNKLYPVHEFAELAGVTVKALHHYDKLGLLKPKRTISGYRMYTEHDLVRLDQINALKFLGVSLKQIKIVLDRPAPDWLDTLRTQRKALEQRQEILSRALGAIRTVEDAIETAGDAQPAVMKHILEVIGMRNELEMMKKYYSTDEAWEKRRHFYEQGPALEWRELYRDIAAVFGQDPGSEAAQALADRWLNLAKKAYSGDPKLQTDSMSAWMHREHWPPLLKRRIAEFNLEEVNKFIQQVVFCARKKYFSERGWAKFWEIRKDPGQFTVIWQSRVDLFRAIESSLHEDPAGKRARALAVRWMAHIDTASAGDPEVKAGLMKAWADRRNWTPTLRHVEESLSMTSSETFERAADFIDRVLESHL